MRKLAVLSALSALGALTGAPAFATMQTAQMQVSLTIQCVAQGEVAQCGSQTFLAKKETIDLPAVESSEQESGQPPLKRRLTTITY